MDNKPPPPTGPPVKYVANPDLVEFVARLVERLRRERVSAIIWLDPTTNVVRVFDARKAGRLDLD